MGLNQRSFALPGHNSQPCADWKPGTLVALPPQWYAVQTRYRFEKKVAEQLDRKGIETFLPLRTEGRRWSDREVSVSVPLFSGYAFARFDGSAMFRRNLLQTTGLIGFVNFQGLPATVPLKQIEDLRLILRQNVACSIYSTIEIGRRARIRGGSLHGLEGVVVSHDKNMLMISIDSIQHSLAIEIQGYELELV